MELEKTLAGNSGWETGARSTGAVQSLLTRGADIGRFTLLGKLGSGGMGVVYAAHDPELDRKVALKVLLPVRDGGPNAAGRARLLREAQALARLSHPNVVAVHDVGTFEGDVWIAMEFVAGQTLDAWARERPRGWPEVLRVLVDAAQGVAAAHAVGLVHRDLKPENVMIGGDGRVRVMDFGLAHGRALTDASLELASTAAADGRARPELDALAAQLTQLGAVQGTPAYMAPEQWQGHEAEATADQFGWCVMAWELLYGERPFAGDTLVTLAAAVLAGQRRPARRGRKVPTWLREVLERGLSLAPARRWPTMTELLAALARGRRRARLRGPLAALGGVVAITVTGVLLGRWDLAQREARCAAAGAEIATVWDDAARARVRAAFVTTGVSHAVTTAERVMPWIDREAEAWQAARSEACAQAELRAAWDADTLRRSLWCLEDRRIELESLVAMLGRADAAAVQQAVSAAAALHAPWPCVDVDTLRRQPKPPDDSVVIQEIRGELARVHTLELAGRYEEALTVASQARARAEAEGEWPPLAVVARAREAEMLIRTADYPQAEALLTDTYYAAVRLGAWEPAEQAAIQLINVIGGKAGRHAEARAWARHAEAVAVHAVDPQRLTESMRLSALAEVEYAAGDIPSALAGFESALRLTEAALGIEHPLVANALNNVAVMHYLSGDLTRARALQERSLELSQRLLGPEHPEVATSLGNLAPVLADLGEHDAAQRLYEQALAIRERALGHDHPDVARNLNNLATMLAEKGEHARARELFTRALAIQERVYGRDNLELSATLNNLALSYDRTGELKEARALFERSLAIYIAALGHDHLNVATTMHNLASTERAQGELAQARALFEQALAIREKLLAPGDLDVATTQTTLAGVLLELGRSREALGLVSRAMTVFTAKPPGTAIEFAARFVLARALVATGGDRALALAEAERARTGFEGLGADDTGTRARIEAWLASQRRGRR